MNDQIPISELTVGELVTLIRETVKDELRISARPEVPVAQHVQLKALLESWANEPDDKSDTWWAEFDDALKQNRFRLRADDV